MSEPLYRRVLGEAFVQLPDPVRALHDVTHASLWVGRADVERGRTVAARLIAWATRLPPSGRDVALSVTFTPDAHGGETWRRAFGSRTFRSHQRAGNGGILERIGPTTILLAPRVAADGLRLEAKRLWVLGVPMPGILVPQVATREHDDGGRYRFEVAAHVRGLGLLVRYTGWLEPRPVTSARRP